MNKRKTKIVCTIGPSCETVEAIGELIEAGMNVARLNFSHSTHDEHRQRIATIREAEARCGTRIAILIDSRGPELRTGKVPDGLRVNLQRGQRVTIDCAATEVSATTSRGGNASSNGGNSVGGSNSSTTGNSNDDTVWTVPVNYSFLPSLVTLGSHLYIADGLIGLSIDHKDAGTITCTVVNGGMLGSYKNINIPGLALPIPTVSDRDLQDIAFGIDNGVDIIALSFVRRAQDVVPVREFLRSNNSEMSIVSKIENEVGVQHIDEIIDVSDGVMIARGDLGIQLPPERVALVQKEIIKQCNAIGKPVITATQMLESMTHHVRPTRAEMTDVANAIFDGSDAIMLSGETAVGTHPTLAVQTLHNIAMSVEHSQPYHDVMYRAAMHPSKITSNSEAVARSTVLLAESIKPQAIIVPTLRGTGPRWLSRYRPMPPIVAVTPSIAVSRRLQVMWGVYPVIADKVSDTDVMLDNAFHIACQQNFVEYGEWAIVVAGVPLDSPTTLNYVTIRYHGKILQRGTNGIGQRTAGKITMLHDVADMERNSLHAIEIAVVPSIDEQSMAVLKDAPSIRGIISERPPAMPLQELRQHNPHIVVVAGVPEAMVLFHNGQHVEINGSERLIYQNE